MAEDLALDVVEQILVGLDVVDLLRFKSVCKSWHSLISSPRFVKAHLNHSYNNDRDNHELGHRRICISVNMNKDSWFYCNHMFIVGSCNGLVCVSPTDVELVVTNPCTRDEKKLPMPPYRPHMHKVAMIRQVVCWGFGYDSSADDYKVIVGFRKSLAEKQTLFHVFTLKSNTWKVIGKVNYTCYGGRSGILCGGTLHWFLMDGHKKKVIISLDISTEEFKEIPVPPPDLLCKCDYFHNLGVIEDCLCIYSYPSPLTSKKWVMKNNRWELYNDHCETKCDVAHHLTTVSHVVDSQNKITYVYSHDDGTRVPINGDYIGINIFVKSLVSPHLHVNNRKYDGEKRNSKGGEVNEGVESGAKGNKRMRKRYCKHKGPFIK